MKRLQSFFTTLLLMSLLSLNASAEPLIDIGKAEFKDGTPVEGGQQFSFDMGTKRVNWTNARWSVHEFGKSRDLSGASGLQLVVETDEPRSDAGVYVALREDDGTWYYAGWAANLTQQSNTGTTRFVDFSTTDYISPAGGSHFDDNDRLDLDRIDAIAIGCVNPLGIGKVSFTVREINLVPATPAPSEAVSIQISGKLLDVNGTEFLPAGLFGGFNLKDIEIDGKKIPRATHYRLAQDRRIDHGGMQSKPVMGDEVTHIMINSVGDRTATSPRLTQASWEEDYTKAGTSMGEAAKADGRMVYVEFWNEPYLNWANANRVNFRPQHYDVSKAAEGGAVHLKIDGKEMPHLKWTQDFEAPPWQWMETLQQWRRGRDEKDRVHVSDSARPYRIPPPKWREETKKWNPPDEVKDGETYTVDNNGKEVQLTAFTPWHIYDETQFTFWSGAGMLRPYVEPMLAYGRAMKKVAPEKIQYIVGWGNRPSEDHWEGFKLLYQPTIDAGIDIIDGINDHDYGGSPVKMPASYEVITAYGMTKHNKWLTSWNTETAMGGDPQAYPEAAGMSAGAQMDAQKFRWTAAKLLHSLENVPDKARSFSWFGIGGGWFSDTGEGRLLELLKNLRGRLVHVSKSAEDIYAVAAVDGADPRNPRPADMPQRQELVFAVFNDRLEDVQVDLQIAAPEGSSFSEAIIRWPEFTGDQGPKLQEKTEKTGSPYKSLATVPSRSLLVLTFPLSGEIGKQSGVRQQQFFSDIILQDVTAKTPVNTSIKVEQQQLSGATRAWLRIATERLDYEEGIVTINGKDYTLPAAVTPENTPFIRDLAIDVKDLKASNELSFRVSGPEHAGYLLGAASLYVEKQ